MEYPGAATVKQAIAYRIFSIFQRCVRLRKLRTSLRQETRCYAKRQLTWFRREQDVRWIARDHVPDRLLVQEAARIVAKELEISYTIE